MSIETLDTTTGNWVLIRCDSCGQYLERQPGQPWRCRLQGTARAYIDHQGWTRSAQGVICSECMSGTSANVAWIDGKLLGFDLETTGVNTQEDLPVSYSLLYYDKGERIKVAGGIINPGREIPQEAIQVHGITNERAQSEGRDLGEVIQEIVGEIIEAGKNNTPIVGMNVSYDLKMMEACAERSLGLSLTDIGWRGPVIDILVIDRHFDKYRKGSRKLVDLCQQYRVSTSTLHDAQNDVEATVQVLFKQYEDFGELAEMSIETLYERQQDWHREWAENYSSYRVATGKDPLSELDMCWPVGQRPKQKNI